MLNGAEQRIVKNGAANLEVYMAGDGPPVVMLASLGRGAEDFADLAAKLVAGGYRVIVPEPRGVGASTGPMAGLTLRDLAGDVIAIIDATADAPVTLIGHAFGNRLARMTAALRPDLINRLILLACGGLIEMPETSLKALIGCFDQTLSRDDHLACVKKAFFAQGNDPAVWQGGWWPEVSAMQSGAVRATPTQDWWEAGGQPMLVVQALEDAIALPANAHDLKERMPGRVTLVELQNAGHAMLPEQPDAIAKAVLDYLPR